MVISSKDMDILIESPINTQWHYPNSLGCISEIDIFFKVEDLKKNQLIKVLEKIKLKECYLHSAIKNGDLQIIDVDRQCLENGLFEEREYYGRYKLIRHPVELGKDPLPLARLVSFKAFDKVWKTNLYDLCKYDL
jgi:hypothetical protein